MAAGCCAAFCMQVSLRAPTEVREALAMEMCIRDSSKDVIKKCLEKIAAFVAQFDLDLNA